MNYGPFEFIDKEIKLIEKEYLTLPEELVEFYFSFMDIISKLVCFTNINCFYKLINDTFITCQYFSEILKFFGSYIFKKDLLEGEKSARYKKTGIKYTLLNFVKEVDMDKNPIFEVFKDYQMYAIIMILYMYNCANFFHKIIKSEKLDYIKDEKENNKYWITSMREFFKNIYYFVNTKSGLFFEYLTIYSSYIRITNDTISNQKLTSLLNFALTRAILHLQYNIFNFSSHYSFIVNETASIDYIRIHYLSFIKLYNKNLDFSSKLGDINKVIENCEKGEKKKKVKALIRDIYNDQNYLQIIVNLSKYHLKCLLALAKNRNNDVSNKFYQLRIVDFMIKELDLEHEASEKIYKIKQYYENKGKSSIEDNLKGSMKIFSNDIPKVKEEYIKSKYRPKETVIEVREEDGSKYYSHSKQTSVMNNFLSIDQQRRKQPSMTESFFDVKKIEFNDEPNEKNIIIDRLDDPSILIDKNKDVIEENDEDDNNEDKDVDDYNEEKEQSVYDSDLSDTSIMLVDIRPKQDVFKDKVPKLSFIPQTFEGFKENKPEMKIQLNIPPIKPVEKVEVRIENPQIKEENKDDTPKPVKNISVKVNEKMNIQEEKKEEKIDIKINLLPLNLNKSGSDRKLVKVPTLSLKSLNNSNANINSVIGDKNSITANKKTEEEKPVIKKCIINLILVNLKSLANIKEKYDLVEGICSGKGDPKSEIPKLNIKNLQNEESNLF